MWSQDANFHCKSFKLHHNKDGRWCSEPCLNFDELVFVPDSFMMSHTDYCYQHLPEPKIYQYQVMTGSVLFWIMTSVTSGRFQVIFIRLKNLKNLCEQVCSGWRRADGSCFCSGSCESTPENWYYNKSILDQSYPYVIDYFDVRDNSFISSEEPLSNTAAHWTCFNSLQWVNTNRLSANPISAHHKHPITVKQQVPSTQIHLRTWSCWLTLITFDQ